MKENIFKQLIVILSYIMKVGLSIVKENVI